MIRRRDADRGPPVDLDVDIVYALVTEYANLNSGSVWKHVSYKLLEVYAQIVVLDW